MPAANQIRAWDPGLDGVREVLHARFTDHAYPAHSHDSWTVLIVDAGAISYALNRDDHAAFPQQVTVLPPYVAHDGEGLRAGGFVKRVLYVDDAVIPSDRLGRAVDEPTITDPLLHAQVAGVHDAIGRGEPFEAQGQLALVSERLDHHLGGVAEPAPAGAPVVRRILDALERHLVESTSLREIATEVGMSEGHLVRTFHRHVGVSPHRYVIGRRVERARTLLLKGMPVADVAADSGFHDQSHLTRHFKRMLSVPPSRFSDL